MAHTRRSPSTNLRATCALPLALLLAACGQSQGQAPSGAPAAVPATVIEASPRRIPITVESVGQVQGSKEVEVRARVSGILLKQLYREGQQVQAGAPLFQIDPAPYEIALTQARAQLAQERARNEQARRESGRLKQLADEKAISQREYDDMSSTLKLSDATLSAAEANVRQKELDLSWTRVTAPVSGITGRLLRSEGSLVTAGQDSALLTTINQVRTVWVRFSLSESDLAALPGGKLGGGKLAEVRLLLSDGSTYSGKGRINFSSTQLDTRLATRELRAEFDNPRAQLLPGQFVRVQLAAGERNNVFLVPQAAVVQTEKGYFLFVLDKDNKATLRPVQVGKWSGADWSVLDGLNAGDRIVVDNLLRLRPGTTVAPQAQKTPADAAEKSAAAKPAAAKK